MDSEPSMFSTDYLVICGRASATIEPDRIKTSYQYDGAPAGSRQSTQITSVRAQRLHWIRRSGSKCRENTGGRGASPERKN